MQTSDLILEISFIVNFALIALLLSMVYPKLIDRYKKRRKRRATQKVSQIKKKEREK